jgi:hypothetical protein
MISPVLHSLARIYADSAAGRVGAGRDFTIDYEKLLRSAGAADGDERELAEEELLDAQRASGGLLAIDRQRRSGLPQTIRLNRDGGEAWLFGALGLPTPAAQRTALATGFERAATLSVPTQWSAAWQQWCGRLAQNALDGGSVQPFKRDDAEGNAELLRALTGVLNWQGESLVRYASALIFGDSKRLQALTPRLSVTLAELTGDGSLEQFGILQKPRTVQLQGSLSIRIGEQTIDFSALPGPVSLSELNLLAASEVTTRSPILLTVENEDVFLELAKRNPGVLLVQTSFPGSGVRRLFDLLPPELTCLHFGDTDPAGFDILRDLREKSGRQILPVLMEPRPSADPSAFGDQERQTLQRVIESPAMADFRPMLETYLAAGNKGDFEQERIPISRVLGELERWLPCVPTTDRAAQ